MDQTLGVILDSFLPLRLYTGATFEMHSTPSIQYPAAARLVQPTAYFTWMAVMAS